MHKIIHLVLFSCLTLMAVGQENFNLDLVANVPVGEDGNDIWGYVDNDGLEYAIMGTRTATRIFSLEDPSNPIERAVISGASSTWRDIKHFEDHLYVTTDQGQDGLLIINMAEAPENITFNFWKPILNVNGAPEPLNKCHNVYVDPDLGYCYLAGCNISAGGVLIFDLNEDKELPVYLGAADIDYAHDVYAYGDRMYASEIYVGEATIYDISDRANPIRINSTPTSMAFTHNAWTSDDQNYMFTTDERGNAWVDAFDISDPEDIKFLDRFQPIETEGTGVIPHNTHYLNGFLVTSWYTDGIVITDATKPDNLVKVGAYDTELNIGQGFEGIWGAYPYLPSGLVLGSDINHGLFIFQPKNGAGDNGYQRACYLEGIVKDKNTGNTIPNVSVIIESNNPNKKITGIMGEYRTGQASEGEFLVTFSHPNYDPVQHSATLIAGEVTILNAEMGNFTLAGTVKDKITGDPITFARVVIENAVTGTSQTVTSDENGEWVVGARENDTYTIYAGKWGYESTSEEIIFTDGDIVDFEIEEGFYQDDFFGDLGWSTGGSAATGFWEIAAPEEKLFGGSGIIQPANDISTDLGNTYYVTGAAGGGAGMDDIDDGTVILTSPMMDFEGKDEISFTFSIFFANVSGNSEPNDYVRVDVTNGIDTYNLFNRTESGFEWEENINVRLEKEDLPFTNTMQVIVTSADDDPGNVVEVGFDGFEAVGSINSGLDLEVDNITLSTFPNPCIDILKITSNEEWTQNSSILISDVNGKLVSKTKKAGTESTINVAALPSGLYTLQLIGKEKQSQTVKFVKK